MALLLPADCEFWVPQAVGVPEHVLSDAIARAQALAEAYTGRKLELSAFVAQLDVAPHTKRLVTGQWPLVVDSTHTLTVVPEADYVVDAATGCLDCIDGYWPSGPRAVTVTGHAGYTAETVPADLKDTLLEIVAWRLGNRGGAGVQSESVDGYSMNLEPIVHGLPESLAKRLDAHRRLSIAWA